MKHKPRQKAIVRHWARMDGLNLKGKTFPKSDLSWSTFCAADLTDADFTKSLLTRCSFRNAILRNTNFAGCDLTFADFRGAIIDSANFSGANLMWAHLCDTNMLRANLRGAILQWSCLNNSGLSPEQMRALPKDVLFSHHQHLDAVYKTRDIPAVAVYRAYNTAKTTVYQTGDKDHYRGRYTPYRKGYL